MKEATNAVSVRYKKDFDTTVPTKAAQAQLHQATVDKFTEKYPDIIIGESTIAKGKVTLIKM